MLSHLYTSHWGKVAIASTLGFAMLLSVAAPASAALSSTQVSAITSLLASFGVDQATIANVQGVLTGSTTPAVYSTTTPQGIDVNLMGLAKPGANNPGVCYLQTMLAADPAVYPEGKITCYFGPLTGAAVKRYQKKHGLPQVGIVGPLTLAKLKGDLVLHPIAKLNEKGQVCAIVPPGHLIAPGWLKKHGGVAPVVPTCQTLPPGIAKQTGGSSGTTTTPTTLSISGVSATSVTSGEATVAWTTSTGASGQVVYGTTTAYGSTTSLNSSLTTSHSFSLSSLAPATTYHFRVVSTASSTTATSSDMTFTTLSAADTAAPVISSVTAGGVATTTATITWSTNESATSKVYYTSGSTIDLSTALTVSDGGMLMNHSIPLTGLTASTTYQFVVSSTDAAGNVATSSASSFTTTN